VLCVRRPGGLPFRSAQCHQRDELAMGSRGKWWSSDLPNVMSPLPAVRLTVFLIS